MPTLAQLKRMVKSKNWYDPDYRWKFGGLASQVIESQGISRQQLAKQLKLSEGTLRHAIHANERLSPAQARRLKGRAIRCFLLIETARTPKQIAQALDTITSGKLDATKARRRLRRQQGKKSTPRFRGDPVVELTGWATEFAAAARELIRLQLAADATTAKRQKLLAALQDAQKAIAEAKKSANP